MNLVAKEFVASRVDDDGVVVLSKFTGAARELKEALQINPFSLEEGAAACLAALEMHPDERRRRMQRMRETVEQNNVYSWAGKFLSELANVQFPESVEEEYSVACARGLSRAAGLGVAV